MKKILLFTMVALMSFSLQLSAEPVTLEKAQVQAREYLQSIGVQVGELSLVAAPKMDSPSRDESVYYYLFNFGEDKGFIIISGDDRTQPVLGYSEEGHAGEEFISSALEPMLQNYKEELDKIVTLDEAHFNRPMHAPSAAGTPVTPMLTCRWAQAAPYNAKAPTYSGSTCKSGCVPVAMAQILYSYRNRMPSTLQNTIPGYTSSTLKLSIGKVAAGTAFNWGNMVDRLTVATTAQTDAVTNLIRYVGVSVCADYRLDNTMASMNRFMSAFPTYFGFANDIKQVYRSSLSLARWKELLVNELNANRPVVIYSEGYFSVAHVFIIDGYDGGDMFHVNWGHGRGDGYFLLSAMNEMQPDDEDAFAYSGQSYTHNMIAYTGIQPLQDYVAPEEDPTLMATINTVNTSSNTVTLSFSNKTSATHNYSAGLGYMDENKQVHILKTWTLGHKAVAGGASVSGVNLALVVKDFTSLGLAKGNYKLYPVYKVDEEEDWKLCDQASNLYYIYTTYGSSLTLVKQIDTPSLSASQLTFPGCHAKNYTQFVSFKVTNNGDQGVRTLYLYASTSSSASTYSSRLDVALEHGESVDALMEFTPTVAGKYNVWVTDGSNKLASGTVTTVSLASSVVYPLVSTSYTLDNRVSSSSKSFYGDVLKGNVTIKNNGSKPYAGYVSVYLYLNGRSALRRCEKYLELAAGASTTIDFYFDELTYGKSYGVIPTYEDSRAFVKPYFNGVIPTKGVIVYQADGSTTGSAAASTVTVPSTAVALDITGVASSITKVTPNSNPNTLYYIGASETAPSGLSGKNVVKGTQASSISLTDGYDFMVPKNFTATSVSFARTPTIGTGGSGGWTSIVLPFDVDNVSVNGEYIDWFKSDTDYGKNFWVKEFEGVSGAKTVCFDYAQEMKANNPYIMAVPNSTWGSKYNLVGKKLLFKGSNARFAKNSSVMVGSDLLNFRGTYVKVSTTNTYVLNSTGTKFSFGNNTVKPFQGFFVATDLDTFGVGDLNIGSFDDTDGIMNLFDETGSRTVDVYNVSGIKVGTAEMQNGNVDLGNLPKGIYVVDGKKIVK